MRQKIGRVCMVLGALLILAAAALLAYNKWDASRADKASQEVLGELEQTLNAAIEEKAKSDTVALQPELDPTQEMTVTELNGWDYIGYLSIPSIGLELPVMSQWSYAGLKIAPGRYSGSTYADNMVVCAHNYAKHFSPIKWLTEGAQVYFTDMDGMRWTYEVSYVENLQPTQIEEMTEKTEESDEWDLTLFTCTTGGSARALCGACGRATRRSQRRPQNKMQKIPCALAQGIFPYPVFSGRCPPSQGITCSECTRQWPLQQPCLRPWP